MRIPKITPEVSNNFSAGFSHIQLVGIQKTEFNYLKNKQTKQRQTKTPTQNKFSRDGITHSRHKHSQN